MTTTGLRSWPADVTMRETGASTVRSYVGGFPVQ